MRGEKTPKRNFAPNGPGTHNHQVMRPTRSSLSHPRGANIMGCLHTQWRQTFPDRDMETDERWQKERESVCVQVLTVRCLTLFSTLFKFYRGSHCTYPYFMKFLFTSTLHNILSEPLAAFHKAIIKIMGSGERGVNAVAKIIISPQKEYWSRWGSDQWSPVLKSSMLPTAQTTNKCILSPALFTF